jgi:hypothetical protein
MSGMGKPQDGQTWIFQESTDSWVSGSAGSGGADNFSTQSIITRMSGSNASRIDRIDSIRLSGSYSSSYSLWTHNFSEYESIDAEGTVIAYANKNSERNQVYFRSNISGSYYRITGSIITVQKDGLSSLYLNANNSELSASLITSGNNLSLNVMQKYGIFDWSSDFVMRKLTTDNSTHPGNLMYVLNNLRLYLDAAEPVSYPGTGVNWYDISGNNKNAILYNAPFYKTDNGGILTFSSSLSHYAEGTAIGSIPNWTMSIWAKVNANIASLATFFSDIFAGSVINYTFYGAGSGTQLQAGFYSSSTWRLTTPEFSPAIGAWNNFVVSYDGAIVRFIVNKTQVASHTTSAASTGGGSGYRVARRWDTTTYINADIPVVMLYDKALNDSEILQNYDYFKGRYGLT